MAKSTNQCNNPTIEFLSNSKNKVAGSVNLLKVNEKNNKQTIKVLLDCGLSQGSDIETDYLNNKKVLDKFKPTDLDLVIITHPHIDHIGLVPALYARNYTGKVIIPKDTKNIVRNILMDSAYIQQLQAEQLDRNPLYSKKNVAQVIDNIIELSTETKYNFKNNKVVFKYYPSGHILGSRMITIYVRSNNPGNCKKLLYTGDIGGKKGQNTPIMKLDTTKFKDFFDTIIVESTYGDREFSQDIVKNDLNMLIRNINNHKKVVIPSFALDRTFIIIKAIYENSRDYDEIVVDSPLATKMTKEYIRILSERGKLTENFENFLKNKVVYPRNRKESISTMNVSKKQVILTSSGMLSGGRSTFWVERALQSQNENNINYSIIFSGYVAENSPGYRVLDKSCKHVELRDKVYRKNCEINRFKSFSSHIHKKELAELLNTTNTNKIILTHGVESAKDSLKKELQLPDSEIVSSNDKEVFKI